MAKMLRYSIYINMSIKHKTRVLLLLFDNFIKNYNLSFCNFNGFKFFKSFNKCYICTTCVFIRHKVFIVFIIIVNYIIIKNSSYVGVIQIKK